MDMNITRCRQLSLYDQSSSISFSVGHINPSADSIFSNQDLLTLILVRLPVRKLKQLTCVSKSWLFLINSPHFSFLRPHPLPCGLFVQRPFNVTSFDPVYYFPLQDVENDNQHRGVIRDYPFRTPTFCHDIFCHDLYGRRLIRILKSSHGLLLCSSNFLASDSERDHYIYNPTTNQLATLPRHGEHNCLYSMSMILVFQPSNSPHYKVVACSTTPQSMSPDLRQFEIYASETRSWRVSGQPFPQPVGINFRNGVYCNGSVYWLSELDSLVGSEANPADCLFFNVEKESLETFPRPPIGLTSSSRRSLYFGESEDHLHVIEVCPYATSLHVYVMKCDHSRWFVKYQVDLVQLSKAFPQMTNDLQDYKVAVLSLVRRDKFHEDSFLVLDIPGKAINYNLVNRSFKEIFEHKVVSDGHLNCGRLKVWQYVECLSSV